jgi:di/tricarboxylate transporter
MDLQIILLLSILVAAIVLFSFEWVSTDIVALGVLILLILTGLLPADQAFAGFGSETVMMILGLLILTAALARTGVVEMAGRAILRRTGEDPQRLLVGIVISALVLGAFISNTAATAFFLPIVIGISRRARLSPSKLLMPLAFATILSSSITLVSTSTNIVVSGMITSYKMAPIQMFELTPVGIPIAIVGLIYMLTLGRRIIPERKQAEELTGEFGLRPYLTEIVILPESPLIGKTLAQSNLGRDLDLTVLRLERGKHHHIAPQASLVLQEDDVLLVEGNSEQILKIKNTSGIDIKANVKFSDPDLQLEDTRLVEAILMPRSPLIGRTLKRHQFRERYGLQVLAINRHGETIRNKISQVVLRMGDVLLLQGHRSNIAALEGSRLLNVLSAVEEHTPHVRRAPLAIPIFVGALAAGTFNLVSFPVAMLMGALLAFLTGCITPEEAYREVEWKILILIGSMLAVGAAMENTGTAVFLSSQIVQLVGQANPLWLLGAFFILTVLLTQPMSNQAAAVVVVPIAIQTALQLGLNPRTFAVMIAVAASTSFLTPLEPACMIVYGPGRYRFMDFFKVGSLLTGIIFILAILLVPSMWPFR